MRVTNVNSHNPISSELRNLEKMCESTDPWFPPLVFIVQSAYFLFKIALFKDFYW